jgi:adenosylhomocysteine nucleosidase
MNSEMKRQNPIGIIMATRMEAEPFLEGLGMKELETRPFPVYMGDDVFMAISGIGKVNAAMATGYACQKFDPACILNLGAAGSVNDSEELGRIYNIEKTVEPDRIHFRTNSPCVQYPDIMDGFEKAILATRDNAVTDVNAFREIAAFAGLVDMEGASVVQASRRFDKKCLLFKFVSDTPLHAGQPDIIDHIKRFRGPFCKTILDSVIPIIRRYSDPPGDRTL